MSLVGTLGKVAMGVLVAKGVGKVMGGGQSGGGGLGGLLGGLTGGAGGQSGGGLGGLLGGLTGGNQSQSGGGGLGGLLGGLTGGNQSGGGGLGGLLGGLTGGGNNRAQAGGQGGGLADLMGSLAGQGQTGAAAGGLGGLLSSLAGGAAGGAAQQQQPQSGGSPDFGSMFNDALMGKEPEQVSQDDEKNAEVLLRAMISAAKADGQLDDEEKRKITEHLGDVSEEEANFVRNELQAPLDLDGLVASVPAGMEQQAYLMSLMAIDLDSKEEAVYLDKLREGLKIDHQTCNAIHAKLGAPQLYS